MRHTLQSFRLHNVIKKSKFYQVIKQVEILWKYMSVYVLIQMHGK